MTIPIFKVRVLAAPIMLGLGLVASVTVQPLVLGQDSKSQEKADEAWQAVVENAKPPSVPPEWQTSRPSEEELAAFRKKEGKRVLEAAEQARKFYEQHPDHAQAGEAKQTEYRMLEMAAMLGNDSQSDRLHELEQERLKDPALSDDEKFEMRARGIQRRALSHQDEGMEVVFQEFEKGVRELQKDFPERPEIYAMLLQIAANSEGDKATKIAEEIAASDAAPAPAKEQAAALLKRAKLVGNPLPIEFTSMNGRKIDLTQMKGKVVLVDFWATWCGPCVAELPNVKAAYEKLHPKGFEIVGISFDESRGRLENFIEEHEMPWPQYFDGKGWQNEIGQEYGIHSIPTMWLIGKDGRLRDLNAREDLVSKVEKLLAEK